MEHRQIVHTHFSLVSERARLKLFDVIGHADLIKKFGHKPKRDMASILLQTIETLKKGNVCVEVNTTDFMNHIKRYIQTSLSKNSVLNTESPQPSVRRPSLKNMGQEFKSPNTTMTSWLHPDSEADEKKTRIN
jgi:hypothetical protein